MIAANEVTRIPRVASEYEEMLVAQLRLIGISEPLRQFHFHPVRNWSADLFWPDLNLIVEVEGAVYANGRHTRGRGFEEDCRKYNAAEMMGYHVLRFSTGMVESGEAFQAIERMAQIERGRE